MLRSTSFRCSLKLIVSIIIIYIRDPPPSLCGSAARREIQTVGLEVAPPKNDVLDSIRPGLEPKHLVGKPTTDSFTKAFALLLFSLVQKESMCRGFRVRQRS